MSRRSNLLPPYLAANPAWVQLVESIDEVFEKEVDLPTELLAKIRDNWILGVTGADKIGNEKMLDNADFFRFERETLIRQANQLGFLLKETDLLTDEEYQRLVRNLGAFWFNKGTPEFIDFMQFVLGCIIDIKKLFALPGPTYDTYGFMREEGDPLIGKLNYQFEEELTPLLPGDAEINTEGGTWVKGAGLVRVGPVPGPTGVEDAVAYKSNSLTTAYIARGTPLENLTDYRYEVWLRRLSPAENTRGVLSVSTDFDNDSAAEEQTLSIAQVPLVWRKYVFDFSTGTYATTTTDTLAIGNWDIGTTLAIAKPQLYKVKRTSVAGQWFETSHVNMVVDPLKYVPGTLAKMVALFNALANYHLVLNTIVFETPIDIHPPGESIGVITKAYPMIDIETTINPNYGLDINFMSGALDANITFTRPDAGPVATRRRMVGSVGPSRTNLLLRSQQFGLAWTRNDATITDNATTAPDGTMTGALVLEGATNGSSVFQTVTVPDGAILTYSVYLKRVDSDFVRFMVANTGAAAGFRAWVNLATGTIVSSDAFAGAAHRSPPTITPTGNGWYRVTITGVLPAGSTAAVPYTMSAISGTAGTTDRALNSSRYIWGAQLELGPVATPYTPTTTAAVTTTDWLRANYAWHSTRDSKAAVPWSTGPAASSLVPATLPDGSVGLVTQVQINGAGGQLRFGQTTGGVPGTRYVGSIWIRWVSGSQTLTSIDVNDAPGPSNIALTSAWKRISCNGVAAGSNPYRFFDLSYSATPQTFQLAMVLLEDDTTSTGLPSAWFPGSNTNSPPFGDLEVVPANTPRFDYTNDGLCRGLLIEPSALNALKDTFNFNAASWSKAGSAAPSVVANSAHVLGRSAALITRGVGNSSYMAQADSSAAGTHTLSIIAKAGGVGNKLGARIQGTYPNRGDALFDLVAGTCAFSHSGTASGSSARMVHIVDGYYLCTLTVTLADAVTQAVFSPCDSAATTSGWEGTSATASTAYVLAAWMEPRANASVWPVSNGSTESARSHEATVISNLAAVGWNSDGWSCVIEWEQGNLTAGQNGTPILLSNGASSLNFVRLFVTPSGVVQLMIDKDGVSVQQAIGNVVANSINRVAFSMTPTRAEAALNGAPSVTRVTDIPTSVLSRINFGTSQSATATHCLEGWLRRFRSFSFAITGTKLQELSA